MRFEGFSIDALKELGLMVLIVFLLVIIGSWVLFKTDVRRELVKK